MLAYVKPKSVFNTTNQRSRGNGRDNQSVPNVAALFADSVLNIRCRNDECEESITAFHRLKVVALLVGV